MAAPEYIATVLQKYSVDRTRAEAAGQAIYPVLAKWGGKFLLKAEFSGSLSKSTAVNICTDADIFLSLTSTTPGTLRNNYETLRNAVHQSGYPVRDQNVSIGTTVNGMKLDLVPGRRQSQHGNDHSLYKSKTDSWTMTNVNTHINYVLTAHRTDEIKLVKIWRALHQIEFPSIYVELSVIEALKHARIGDLPANFLLVLEYFRDTLSGARFVDPANTNNVISDEISMVQKQSIASQANVSRNQENWQTIIW